MNQKGLTLIEMIATLVILSVIALIVTPNIYGTLKDYKNQLFETQMNNVVEATKSWATDNIKLLPSNNSYALKVTVQELQKDGYLKDNLKNPRDGGTFDESKIFTLITCNYVEDETGNFASNYNYIYVAYEDIEDYEKEMAIKYIKDNNLSTQEIEVSTLKTNGYIETTIKDTSDTLITVPNNTILVTVSEVDGEIIYEATIK